MSQRDLFIAALQRTDPVEQAAFLDQACAGDAALRQRIEELLRAHTQASEVLRASPPADAQTDGSSHRRQRPTAVRSASNPINPPPTR